MAGLPDLRIDYFKCMALQGLQLCHCPNQLSASAKTSGGLRMLGGGLIGGRLYEADRQLGGECSTNEGGSNPFLGYPD